MDKQRVHVEKLISYIASSAIDRTQLQLQTKYPHVWTIVVTSWGTQDFSDYMDSLLVVDSRVVREGFSLNALMEVMKLIQAHDILYPDLTKSKPQVFW